MLHDLRYSVRSLARRPSFAAGTILVLALAVGVNTAVFSIINALLLRPLPVPTADRLGFVYDSDERSAGIAFGWYRELRQKIDVFDAMAARSPDAGRLRNGVDVIPLQGEAVTAGYFELLGVSPRLGRTIQSDDDRASANPVAIISEALWKSQFAADPGVIGRTLRIDAAGAFATFYAASWRDYTIVGVMPASFTGTGNPWQPAQYWVSIEARSTDYRAALGDRATPLDNRGVVPIGSLKPGVAFAQARAAVDAAGRDILQRSSERPKNDATFQLLTARRCTASVPGRLLHGRAAHSRHARRDRDAAARDRRR